MLLRRRNGHHAIRSVKTLLFLLFFLGSCSAAYSQLAATITSSLNTNCNGTDCDYSGPSILINELMISPLVNDGSLSGPGGGQSGRGEWIELYNPNTCEPVDISCFYLGNDTPDGSGGYVIPAGTIIPPSGFCLIRGANMTAVPTNLLVANGGNVVELVVPPNLPSPGICVSMFTTRMWFPNLGGWFAFYDSNGVPQDAVSWGNQDNTDGFPCVPTLAGCTNVASLNSYDQIPAARKAYVSNSPDASLHAGNSLRRSTDGGSWALNNPGAPTYAVCNATCIPAGTSTCTGSATATATGGTAPYSYQWDDSQAQMTATASDLCAGQYCVTITDADGTEIVECVTISDFVPTVALSIPTDICINASPVAINSGTPAAAPGQTGVYAGTGVSGVNFNPTTAGTGAHTVTYTYTDQFGCTNLATDNITVHPLPTGSITGINSPYCISQTPVNFTLTPAGGTLSGPGTTNNTFIPATAGIGTHTLTYTFTDGNSCSNSVTANVQVVASPSPAINIPAFLCIYDPAITLNGTPANGVFTVNGTPATTLNPSTTGAGTHEVIYIVTDANGCIGTDSTDIAVIPRPQLAISAAANHCFGTGSVPVGLTPAGGTLSGDFVAGTMLNLTAAAAGSYTITYEYADANGCENTADHQFTVSPRLFPNFDYSVNCSQIASFVNLTPANPVVAGFGWNFDGTGTSTQYAPSVPFALPGNYDVTLAATDSYNCVYDTTISIYVEPGVAVENMVIPNVITANGDNINDFIEFPAEFLECFTYKMYIVNRWGQLVYEMSNSNNRFYGLDKSGNDLDEGVYFYTIESEDFDCDEPLYKGMCSGNITIRR